MADPLRIHNHPQKAAYTDWLTEAPPIDFQVHWKPGNPGTPATPPMMTLIPGLAHTHIQVTAPWWAELGDQDITLPVVFKLFQTAGEIVSVTSQFTGEWGEKEINDANGNSRLSIPGQPWPYHIRGNPTGLVLIPASLTFNLKDGLDVGTPVHGWARINIAVRIRYDNGDEVTENARLSFFSVLDPTAPELITGEAGINLAVHGSVQSARDGTDAFKAQLTEFKSLLPILAPITTPQITDVFAYNYAPDQGLFPIQLYEMLLDPDFHMGIPGTVQPTQMLGTTGNIDVWKPATIAASPAPMGLAPGVHRLGFSWILDTGNGFQAEHGFMSAGERLVTLITVPITIGPNPTDSGPATDWSPTPVPPPVQPAVFIGTHPDLTAVSPDGQPIAVSFLPPTASGGTPPITVTSLPASGSLFPVGVTHVTCLAKDSVGQQAQSAFLVTVTGAVTPPEGWHTITPLFQRKGDQVCICDTADMKCLVLGTLIVDVDDLP